MTIVARSERHPGVDLRFDEEVREVYPAVGQGLARDGAPWAEPFYAYVENCFDPYRYVVWGEGDSANERLQDAWEWLIEQPRIVAELRIGEAEAPDYLDEHGEPEGGTYNSSGDWLDTESLIMFGPVRLVVTFD